MYNEAIRALLMKVTTRTSTGKIKESDSMGKELEFQSLLTDEEVQQNFAG